MVLDLGGTLVQHRIGTPEHEQRKADALIDLQRMLSRYARLPEDLTAFRECYESTARTLFLDALSNDLAMTEADAVQAVVAAYGGSIDRDSASAYARTFAKAILSLSTIFDDTMPVLDNLQRHGVPMGLISNTPYPGEAHREELEDHGLAEYFAFTLFSSDEGTTKPHPRLFQRAIDRLGLTPDRIAYVGDRPIDDVTGAQHAGMKGVLIDREGRFDPAESTVSPDQVCQRLYGLLSWVR